MSKSNEIRAELSLADAARLTESDPETLRRILRRPDTPPELRRRAAQPPWVLDSKALGAHLRAAGKPRLADRLADRLRHRPTRPVA